MAACAVAALELTGTTHWFHSGTPSTKIIKKVGNPTPPPKNNVSAGADSQKAPTADTGHVVGGGATATTGCEAGALLEGLALAPMPAVSGLAEWPFALEMHNERERLDRYEESRLSLTALGEAILAGTEDFSHHNPIDRWWGGTRLTNDRLWRWDPVLLVP